MDDQHKTKDELIAELHHLRREVAQVKNQCEHLRQQEEAAHGTREDLEIRVQKRTSELARVNVEMREEIERHQKTEDKLRESEELYRGVVDNIGIGVVLISPAMEILTLNRQMMEWFPHVNIDAKPVCYRSFNTPARDSICDYCPTRKTLDDGCVHEAVSQTPVDGVIRNYRIISSPIKDENQRVIAAVEMVEDITKE
jgi:PAS domain-containing protein